MDFYYSFGFYGAFPIKIFNNEGAIMKLFFEIDEFENLT
jgi:hypothetical protein